MREGGGLNMIMNECFRVSTKTHCRILQKENIMGPKQFIIYGNGTIFLSVNPDLGPYRLG